MLHLVSKQTHLMARIVKQDFTCVRTLKIITLSSSASQEFMSISSLVTDRNLTRLQPGIFAKREFSLTSCKTFISKEDYKVPDKHYNKLDKVPEDFDIIYLVDTTLAFGLTVIVCLALVSFFSSIVFLVLVFSDYEFRVPFDTKTKYGLAVSALLFIMVVSIPATRVHLHSVHRMYYNKNTKEFVAVVTKGWSGRQNITFKKQEAQAAYKSELHNFQIKDRFYHLKEYGFAMFGKQKFYSDWFYEKTE